MAVGQVVAVRRHHSIRRRIWQPRPKAAEPIHHSGMFTAFVAVMIATYFIWRDDTGLLTGTLVHHREKYHRRVNTRLKRERQRPRGRRDVDLQSLCDDLAP